MTIDERVERLGKEIAHLRGKAGKSYEREFDAYQNNLRLTLLEVARDQRHACAESVNNLIATDHEEPSRDRAYHAVMNTELPK